MAAPGPSPRRPLLLWDFIPEGPCWAGVSRWAWECQVKRSIAGVFKVVGLVRTPQTRCLSVGGVLGRARGRVSSGPKGTAPEPRHAAHSGTGPSHMGPRYGPGGAVPLGHHRVGPEPRDKCSRKKQTRERERVMTAAGTGVTWPGWAPPQGPDAKDGGAHLPLPGRLQGAVSLEKQRGHMRMEGPFQNILEPGRGTGV